ncbi:MAG: hypothetical protein WAX07_01785 [Candidatus Altiarchaeia archaeon]
MTQKVRVSGWIIEIPDCWKIEYNNFPNKVFQVEDLKGFDTLFKAVSSTGYTMTVDWIPPRSEHGRFIFRVVDSENGFEAREYAEDFVRPGALMSIIEIFNWGLCSNEHKKIWLEGGEVAIPYQKGSFVYKGKTIRLESIVSPSRPFYYPLKEKYFRFEGEEGFIYDATSGKELFRKKLHYSNIKNIITDPFNRGFLIYFDSIPKTYDNLDSYQNSGEQFDGIQYTSLPNPRSRDFPKNYSNLGLFDENLNVVWWAESLRKIKSYYSHLRKYEDGFMEFSAYGRGVKLDSKTGKIIEDWFEK